MTDFSRVNPEDHVIDFTEVSQTPRLPVEPCLLGTFRNSVNAVLRANEKTREEDVFLFQYVISGEADYVSPNVRHHLKKGEAFLSCSHVFWKCLPVSSSTPFRSLIYIIRGETALSIGRQLMQHGSKMLLSEQSPSLELLHRHLQELRGQTSINRSDESVLAYRFLISLLIEQEQDSQSSEPSLPALGEAAGDDNIPENLRRATEYIKAHFSNTMLNVETIAKVAGFSKYHFIRLFEKTYGISPWKYLLAQRLYHAAQLLAQDTRMPIKAIIQLCGFTSETYFCRVFRKTYKRSPGSHRRLMSSTIPETL